MTDASAADLIIVVRRGSGKLVNETVTNPRQNDRPGYIDPTDTGIAGGLQRGTPPGTAGPPDPAADRSPHPQTEVGNADDSFLVYEGQREDALDGAPGWRYVAKDGLRPHTVPAVDAFRKALDEADKAAAKKP